MPGKTVNQQKKGRGKALADAKMAKTVKVIMAGEEATFAVITKSIGCNRYIVALQDKKEAQAQIYSKVLRKAKCWTAGTLAIVGEGARAGEWEILSALERTDAKRLIKEGAMPHWMLATAELAGTAQGVEGGEDCGFDFEEDEAEPEEKKEGAAGAVAKRVPKREAGGVWVEQMAALQQEDDRIDIDAI
jgi:hypothetical protein